MKRLSQLKDLTQMRIDRLWLLSIGIVSIVFFSYVFYITNTRAETFVNLQSWGQDDGKRIKVDSFFLADVFFVDLLLPYPCHYRNF